MFSQEDMFDSISHITMDFTQNISNMTHIDDGNRGALAIETIK